MRTLNTAKIADAVKTLCIDANRHLPADLENCIHCCKQNETNTVAKAVFEDMTENINAANELDIAVCQDTGMAVVFVEVGQEVLLVGAPLEEAINAGVAEGYTSGNLRLSVVGDPLERVNTNNNTPAIIHTKIVNGDKVKVSVAPKGFGSENMSGVKMFTPSATEDDIVDFVADCVKNAGSKPCPPVVVGVGIGGDFEYSAILAKTALCRSVDERNANERYAKLEEKMLEKINSLGIGPQGFGGDTTALAVNIEYFATHIAGLPVAVNMGCHVTRHKSVTI